MKTLTKKTVSKSRSSVRVTIDSSNILWTDLLEKTNADSKFKDIQRMEPSPRLPCDVKYPLMHAQKLLCKTCIDQYKQDFAYGLIGSLWILPYIFIAAIWVSSECRDESTLKSDLTARDNKKYKGNENVLKKASLNTSKMTAVQRRERQVDLTCMYVYTLRISVHVHL